MLTRRSNLPVIKSANITPLNPCLGRLVMNSNDTVESDPIFIDNIELNAKMGN